MDTPQLIRGHPPLIEFSSSLIKLEDYVNLSYSKTAFYRYLGISFLYGILVNSQEQLILL